MMPTETPPERRVGRRVFAVLAIAIALDTVGQILWKLTAVRLPSNISPGVVFQAILHEPLALLLIGVFLLQLVNWLLVLERVDLSYAQPLTALSYVSVCLLSAWLLDERLHGRRIIGVSLVLVGVLLVSRSPIRRDDR